MFGLFLQSVAFFLPEIPVLTSLEVEEAVIFGALYHEAIQSKL
jgi:hypothetical protein